jgi:hypothetical protein
MSTFIQRDGKITSAATEAPERIWAYSRSTANPSSVWSVQHPREDSAVEYTRADLIAAREAAARREGWNAATEAAAKVAEEQAEWMPIKQGDMSKAILAMKETEQ